jgi:glycerate kinase
MPHVVAAPDKFRGTASAVDAAAAMVEAARQCGWSGTAVPMSDGGEGLLDVIGGDERSSTVSGPLGQSVEAHWRLLPATAQHPETAVIEMAQAAGRALLPQPEAQDPVNATTTGVGQLLRTARDSGARRIVIGCGGSATTDGGLGALEAAGPPGEWTQVELVVACDVTTRFTDAAAVFGPQKDASADQVLELTDRLHQLAGRYQRDYGLDVGGIPGSGAAGGLAGALVVLGAHIVPGFGLVADLCDLAGHVERADLVMTGEGNLDPPSFHGKVPGGVLALVSGRCPVVCIAGDADAELVADPPLGLEIVSLTDHFGSDRAWSDTLTCIGEATPLALRLKRH